MTTTQELSAESNSVVDELLHHTPKLRNKFARPFLIRARVVIEAVTRQMLNQFAEIERLKDRSKADVRKAREDAEKIDNRICLAISELEGTKNNRKVEKCAAVILSPWQMERLSWSYPKRWITDSKGRSIRKFKGIPIYTAKGVYGPLALTEDGFNGLSRQAPELMLKAA